MSESGGDGGLGCGLVILEVVVFLLVFAMLSLWNSLVCAGIPIRNEIPFKWIAPHVLWDCEPIKDTEDA